MDGQTGWWWGSGHAIPQYGKMWHSKYLKLKEFEKKAEAGRSLWPPPALPPTPPHPPAIYPPSQVINVPCEVPSCQKKTFLSLEMGVYGWEILQTSLVTSSPFTTSSSNLCLVNSSRICLLNKQTNKTKASCSGQSFGSSFSCEGFRVHIHIQ